MFNNDIHNSSDDIDIYNGASPMWRLNMLFGPCVMTLCYHIWLFCFCNVLICHCTLAFGYYTLLFCHCILVFLNFDIRNSSFAVVICHFHSVRFIIVFCQGYTQFGMTLRKGDPKSRNGGMAEWWNSGKCPQILKHGTAENDPKS